MKIIIDKKFRKKAGCIAIVFIAFLASLTFYVRSYENMDFVRIQIGMNSLYHTRQTLIEYLTGYSSTLNTTLTYTVTYNILRFLVAKYTKNPYVLVWVSAIIDYSIISYIIYDWNKDSEYTLQQKVCIFLFNMSMLPFVHVCSGIRAAMAASIMILSVYHFVYKDYSIIRFVVGCFLAVTTHPFVLFAIPIAIVSKIMPKFRTFLIAWLGAVSLTYLMPLFERLNIPFLSVLVAKYYTYTSENQFTAYRSFFYGTILICFLLISYYFLFIWSPNKKRINVKENKNKIYIFVVSYAGLIIGNVGGYELVCRSAYILGAFAPVIIGMLYDGKTSGNRGFIAMIFRLMIISLSVYVFMMHIHFLGRHFSISHIPISINPSLQ